MATFRSRPFEVDAEQYRTGELVRGVFSREDGTAYCMNINGVACEVKDGDWIIREPRNMGFYPCANSVFSEKYERAE